MRGNLVDDEDRGYGGKVNRWILGSRPRTLPAAVVPVAVGAAVCVGEGGVHWWRVSLALIVALSLQIGVNFANDYSDGVRGTDDERQGPTRLVASGMAGPSAVLTAALVSFGVAAAAGLVLALLSSPWILGVGATALLAGWFYTGGPRPYGYLGLGEVFVFVYFGLVATVGTTFVLIERIPALVWVLGSSLGCWACALLVINNLRDIPTDELTGKRTLAVRLGDAVTRHLYTVLIVGGIALGLVAWVRSPWCVLAALVVVAVIGPIRAVRAGAVGRDLIPVLGQTGRAQLLFGLLLCAGFLIGG